MELTINTLDKLVFKYRYESNIKMLTYMVLIDFAFSSILSFLVINIIDDKAFDADFLEETSQGAIFISYVVLGPIIETFIYQFLIIEAILLMKNKINIPNIVPISVSALAFGISHNYNVLYIISMILIGILYATYYLIAKYNTNMKAYLSVLLVHSFANLIGFVIEN
ncbi:CPBP family glutamic-type intramembrane protease [Lunatimonas salinarum]|uniref:CPBP family glutamic-type intramembrane protease n=1 Tax=Lunatimonas salinarum TaxID=1774590 RepID=UPI001ADF8A0C|nr:CPBP family glutamic-type intramembrane protease [Lunatimonas salinarum]